jgi:hypothetical protein
MYMHWHKSTWIYVNYYEFIWIQTISIEYTGIYTNTLTWFDLILFQIYTNLFKYILNLLENMHTVALLLHTDGAMLCQTAAHCCKHCHTLPRALRHTGKCTATHMRVHCRRHPCALSYTAALRHSRTLPHTAACAHPTHCLNWSAAHHRTPFTAHRTQSHTAINMYLNDLFECVWIHMNLCELMWMHINQINFI